MKKNVILSYVLGTLCVWGLTGCNDVNGIEDGWHPGLVKVVPVDGSGQNNGHAYVDLGLSVKWATMNIGASAPEDFGSYYAWGEIAAKEEYNWTTYKYSDAAGQTFTRYCVDAAYGRVDGKAILDLADDVASLTWGNRWRMPTADEMAELREKCTWAWTTLNGVSGYRVTGTNGNFIFLPPAGSVQDKTSMYVGTYGYYWSCSLDEAESDRAYGLYFDPRGVAENAGTRNSGQCVRPVCP